TCQGITPTIPQARTVSCLSTRCWCDSGPHFFICQLEADVNEDRSRDSSVISFTECIHALSPFTCRSIIRYLRMMHGGAKDLPSGRTSPKRARFFTATTSHTCPPILGL